MFKTIEGAADCEIPSVIRFLNARNVLPSEIHHQICQVYVDNDTYIKRYSFYPAQNVSYYVVGSKSFRPDIQKPCQMENAVRDI